MAKSASMRPSPCSRRYAHTHHTRPMKRYPQVGLARYGSPGYSPVNSLRPALTSRPDDPVMPYLHPRAGLVEEPHGRRLAAPARTHLRRSRTFLPSSLSKSPTPAPPLPSPTSSLYEVLSKAESFGGVQNKGPEHKQAALDKLKKAVETGAKGDRKDTWLAMAQVRTRTSTEPQDPFGKINSV